MNLDPIRAAVAPYMLAIKAAALVLALGLVWWHGFDTGRDRWQGKFDAEVTAHRATKAEHKAIVDSLAERTRAAEAKAKAATKQAAIDRKTNDMTFRMLNDEAQQARSALARALRNGSVRLQARWACPAARPAEGDAAALASGQDGNAGLREAGALDLVSGADHADRWIIWLQSEVTSTRKACGADP